MEEKDADKMISEARGPAQRPKPTFDEMIDAVRYQANVYEGRERVLLLIDQAMAPDETAMRHAAILDAIGNFLEQVRDDPEKVAKGLYTRARRQREASNANTAG